MRGYRAHLDGLRGVAIALVLVAHFTRGVEPHGSGHVGVGLFFALSGYLITGLLLDEHARGRVDLLAFYARRAGRLMPGLLLVVVVTAPALVWVTGSRQTVARSAMAALTYTTNYAYITHWPPGGGVYGQTWSLAIEEHFYLLWAPLLVYAARRGGARSVLRYALIGATVAIAARLEVAYVWHSWAWAARGSFARGDALLLGCAAAAAVRLGFRSPRWVLPLSLVGIAWSSVALPGEGQGHVMTLAVGLVVLSLSAAGVVVAVDQRSGLVARALSSRPLVWLGVLSYSLYLWHVPALILGEGHMPPVVIFAATVAVSWLSHRFVEQPARAAVRARLARRGAVRRAVALSAAV